MTPAILTEYRKLRERVELFLMETRLEPPLDDLAAEVHEITDELARLGEY